MKDEYKVNVLPQVFELYSSTLMRDTERGLPQNPSNLFACLSSGEFKTLGICEYVMNHDIKKMKNYFYNSIVAAQRGLELYDLGKENTLGTSMMNFWSLYLGIISDNYNAVLTFAKLMGGRDMMEKRTTSIHVYNLGYALKYLVLDDYENAKSFIEKIEKKSNHAYNFGLFETLQGILEKDASLVDIGLKKRMQYYKKSREFKDSPEEFFSIEITALAKLASMKGIEVNIDEDIAPKEIIDKTEMEYELHEIMKLEYL